MWWKKETLSSYITNEAKNTTIKFIFLNEKNRVRQKYHRKNCKKISPSSEKPLKILCKIKPPVMVSLFQSSHLLIEFFHFPCTYLTCTLLRCDSHLLIEFLYYPSTFREQDQLLCFNLEWLYKNTTQFEPKSIFLLVSNFLSVSIYSKR